MKVLQLLGFGDAEGDDNSMVIDRSNTNNGDMYKVFNTVLHSIPLFYELHPSAFLFITGYDAIRKRVYGRYVKQNIDILNESYLILGCYIEGGEIIAVESYNKTSEYGGFLIVQRDFI